ncbi:MAG: GWxTD domain-containing protein [Bacteroidetes bacterium]|nr:GWxTD domain-containing protein [Bacteroidota bacterium]
MYRKIVIAFIFCSMIFQGLYGQENASFFSLKDTIQEVQVSNILRHTELEKMDFAFFDLDAEKIYFQVQLSGHKNFSATSFIYVEIKKKTNMQFKLKPLYTKKILFDSLHNEAYLDSISLSTVRLGSGNFDLIVSLINDSSKVLQVKKAGFQLLRSANEKVVDEYYELETTAKDHIVKIENTFVAKYDLATIKRNISALQPISLGIEAKVIRDITGLDDISFLRLFFYNFWYNRNASNPEEEWKKYTEKLNYVAKLYGTSTQPGYETDRGRIYITYGEPDRVEKLPSEKDALPYEIWWYKHIDTKSNISFLFFQPGMVGTQMFLLHSNMPSEIINPYWKETLLLDPNNGDNKLMHRVFEYFK